MNARDTLDLACELCTPLPGHLPARVFARGLCCACYRKLREAGCDLRPSRRGVRVDARTPAERLRDWLRTWTPDRRARLRTALQDAEAV